MLSKKQWNIGILILITKKEEYLEVISQIFEWLNDEMIDSKGGFYSSMDADSEGVEGKYYVWKRSQIEKILGKEDADVFAQYFDITEEGNWEGNSIPRIIMKKSSLSNFLKIPEDKRKESLSNSRIKLNYFYGFWCIYAHAKRSPSTPGSPNVGKGRRF